MCNKTYKWNYDNEELPLKEYLKKIHNLIDPAISALREFDGDMMMSDYRKLQSGAYRIEHLLDQMKSDE